MSIPQIVVRNLSKTYRVPEREAGLIASIQSLWARKYRNVEAVRDISFSIAAGEIVGFLGPNGAGKTTTLKMLSGLLYPTAGEVRVAGFVPWKREPAYLQRISMVFGNKSQVLWDIPPKDSFRVMGEIYHVPLCNLSRMLDELVELLDMHALLAKPVRTLSLGERMKCELVAALLYQPKVLFLDEPTLGLDLSMQQRFRHFIAEYNRLYGATIILTSHYMADIVALCPRVIVINHGSLLYDGSLQKLACQLAPSKVLRLIISDEYTQVNPDLTFPTGVEVLAHEGASWTLSVPQAKVPTVAASLLNNFPIVDLAIEDPPIETVVNQVYQWSPSPHLTGGIDAGTQEEQELFRNENVGVPVTGNSQGGER
ncbi:MAG TPA: ATP-binding cassette domain-containing protein [Ktedonobacteraceae bacterium]|nr:ATP-binding cassette domain-containing protein [Ktedonobacteraceae bacterium]